MTSLLNPLPNHLLTAANMKLLKKRLHLKIGVVNGTTTAWSTRPLRKQTDLEERSEKMESTCMKASSRTVNCMESLDLSDCCGPCCPWEEDWDATFTFIKMVISKTNLTEQSLFV
jgi:hypothetical protein